MADSPVILVAIAGLTPQVITETLYALHRRGEVPAEIHVLTTLPGRQRVRELLLDPRRGAFYRFCSEYGLDHRGIRFDLSTVHVLSGPDGLPIEDLRSAEENEAVADQVLSFVRALAGRRDRRIHASLAGGRKTMTFYLGYALSLLGRRHDRLSHVLVPEDFEGHPEFFYPPREPKELRTVAEKWISTADARVDLVDIPFVRLRDHVLASALQGTFADLIRETQQELSVHRPFPELQVELDGNRLRVGPHACRLADQPFAVYLELLLVRTLLQPEPEEEDGFRTFDDLVGEEFLETLWARAAEAAGRGRSAQLDRLLSFLECLAKSRRGDRNFVAVVTKVNHALELSVPDHVADALRIRRAGKNPTRYGVRLPPERIRIGFTALG